MLSGPLLIGLLATVSLGGIALVAMPYLSGEVVAERRKDQFINRTEAREAAVAQRTAASRREQVTKSLKELDQRGGAKRKVDLATRITQAGLTWTPQRFYIMSAVVGLVAALLCFVVTGSIPVTIAGLLVGGLGLPRWLLSFLTKRRIKSFLNEFPNAMDVVVRGVKSGLPLGDCLRIIASESAEPVRSEFRYIMESQALGLTVAEAAERLYQRVPVTEANFFGIVIAIQQRSGGNLAETLGNFSRVLRERRKMKGKIQAMSMEAKASASIIGILPFAVAILVYISSPDYIMLLFTTVHGKLALLAGGIWMVIGLLVMRKMINFDI